MHAFLAIAALLADHDGAPCAIIAKDADQVQPVLYCRHQFLPAHEKAAVPDKGDGRAVRLGQRRADAAGCCIAHGARHRACLGMGLVEAVVAMHPTGEGAAVG